MTPLGWIVIPALIVGLALGLALLLHAVGVPSWLIWLVCIALFVAIRQDRP